MSDCLSETRAKIAKQSCQMKEGKALDGLALPTQCPTQVWRFPASGPGAIGGAQRTFRRSEPPASRLGFARHHGKTLKGNCERSMGPANHSRETTYGRGARNETLQLLKRDEWRARDGRVRLGRDELLFRGCQPRDAWPPLCGALLRARGVQPPSNGVPLPVSTL